jgi:hypothetical protein
MHKLRLPFPLSNIVVKAVVRLELSPHIILTFAVAGCQHPDYLASRSKETDESCGALLDLLLKTGRLLNEIATHTAYKRSEHTSSARNHSGDRRVAHATTQTQSFGTARAPRRMAIT